jgi:hypothetical protein
MIPLLLKYGTPVNVDWVKGTVLSFGVARSIELYSGDEDYDALVRMLIEAGANVNKPSISVGASLYGKILTSLELAIDLGLHNV